MLSLALYFPPPAAKKADHPKNPANVIIPSVKLSEAQTPESIPVTIPIAIRDGM